MIPAIIAGAAAAANLAKGIWDSHNQREAARQAQEAAGNAARSVSSGWYGSQSMRSDIDSLLDEYAGRMSDVYGDIDNIGKEYSSLLLGNGTTYNPTEFDYDKSVENFYDPAWVVNNNAQMRALENGAANSGHLFSSGLAQNMAGTTSANATNAYKEAREAYYADKQLAQDQWYKANQLAKDKAALNLQRANQLGDYTNGYNDWLSNYTNAKQSNWSAYISDYNNALNNYATLVAQAGDYDPSSTPSMSATFNKSFPKPGTQASMPLV